MTYTMEQIVGALETDLDTLRALIPEDADEVDALVFGGACRWALEFVTYTADGQSPLDAIEAIGRADHARHFLNWVTASLGWQEPQAYIDRQIEWLQASILRHKAARP